MSQTMTIAISKRPPAMTIPATSTRFAADMRITGPPAGLLGFYQADGLEHLGDAGLLLLEEGSEGVAGQIGVVPALLFENLLPGRGLHRLIDRLAQTLALLRGNTRRRHDRTPIGDDEIDALFLERRHVNAGEHLGRGHADGAELAGF